MGALSGLEPKSVFYYFEEVTKIPHGSGNVERISDYLVRFAGERGLFHIQDERKNVIIIKEATPGYEKEPPVILQGHMDMVAVHKPDYAIDMVTDGLKVGIDGDNLYAEGTSLGGDDGVAVAYALALLDSDEIRHPRLEVVITVDEEVGMDGAREIDLSMLKGHRMVNLDSEEEGIFLSSCAGGARVRCLLPYRQTVRKGMTVEVEIGGLRGGHSGEEIDKGRGNANCLFGRLLWNVTEELNVGLVSVDGGLADNAIPRETKAVLVVNAMGLPMLETIIERTVGEIAGELASGDPDVRIRIVKETDIEEENIRCVAPEDTRRIAAFLASAPNGVQAMSADIADLVETSLNLGMLHCQADLESDGKLEAVFSVRSSIESAKRALIARLQALTSLAGGSNQVTGDYPGWQYRASSPLREKMVTLYEQMYGKKPIVRAIHAGLECGLLAAKIPDLDCVSIGPDMKNIHTTEETLSISSTARVWEFLVRLLEEKDKA